MQQENVFTTTFQMTMKLKWVILL